MRGTILALAALALFSGEAAASTVHPDFGPYFTGRTPAALEDPAGYNFSVAADEVSPPAADLNEIAPAAGDTAVDNAANSNNLPKEGENPPSAPVSQP